MANTMTKPRAISPAAMLAELEQLDAGIVANLAANVTLMVEGKPMTQAQLHTSLQSAIAVFKLPGAIYEQFKAAVATRLGITVATRAQQKDIKNAIKLQFGSQSPLLASFGIPTDKPIPEATSAQKMVAAVKRSQTRKVRGTKGKKQAAAIKVVGNPPISVASDGQLTSSPPPVNLPAADGTGSGTNGGSPPTAK